MTATVPELDLSLALNPPIRCDAVDGPDGVPFEQATPCAELAAWDVLHSCAHAARDLSHLCDRHKGLLGQCGPALCSLGHPVTVLAVYPRGA